MKTKKKTLNSGARTFHLIATNVMACKSYHSKKLMSEEISWNLIIYMNNNRLK